MQTRDLTTSDPAPFDLLQRRGLYAAIGGLVIGGLGTFLQPAQFMPSWLIGFAFCTGLSLGCLALLMTQYMTSGYWGLVTRRIFEAGARLLPFCALLFIPIAVRASSLYLWARPDAVAADPVLLHKKLFLNLGFFIVRAFVYFAVWIGCATLLTRWSTQQDRGEAAVTESDTRRFRVISGPGLVLFVLLVSLASIDWLMSLDPHWYSTIFGFIIVAGQALCALSFSVAVLAILVRREPMNDVVRAVHFHDLGKLMLAFVMLWAYFSFSQFLIIWAGNLPEEITFYLARLNNGWGFVSSIIVVGHFVLPFCLLLSADLKKRPNALAAVAWFIVAIRLVDLIWIVAPTFNQGGMPVSLANVGVPIGLAGLWLYLFAGQLRKHPLVPVNDPDFKDMLAHEQYGGH
jgi:hypothetical protein